MNIELLRRIAAIELAEPLALEMSTWENGCGTTRCIAGWAVHEAASAPIWDEDGYSLGFVSFMAANYPAWDVASEDFPVDAAADLLGLTEEQEAALFYTHNGRARAFLELVRSGGTEIQLAAFLADEGNHQ